MLNIYNKLNNLILELQSSNIKKNGYNSHAKFYYYELEDILTVLIPLLNKHKVFLKFNKLGEELELINVENLEEKILFSTNQNLELNITKSNDIQLLGAYSTYCKRYNILQAFLIAENDTIDATNQLNTNTNNNNNNNISQTTKNKVDKNKKNIKVKEEKLIFEKPQNFIIYQFEEYEKYNMYYISLYDDPEQKYQVLVDKKKKYNLDELLICNLIKHKNYYLIREEKNVKKR